MFIHTCINVHAHMHTCTPWGRRKDRRKEGRTRKEKDGRKGRMDGMNVGRKEGRKGRKDRTEGKDGRKSG
jgi:hypothetical protein